MSSAQDTADRGNKCSTCGRSGASVRKLFGPRAGGAQLVICDQCVAECAETIADVPTRIPGAAKACAFCAKPDDQVAVMVAIGSAMICDECVDAYRAQLG